MRKPKHMIHEPCDPGCPGWFVSGDTGKVERCDECDLFADDDDALAHVVDAAESLALIERALRAAQAKRPPKTAIREITINAWPGGARFSARSAAPSRSFVSACTLLDALQRFAQGANPVASRRRDAERELLARFWNHASQLAAVIEPKGAAQREAARRLFGAGLLRRTTITRRGRVCDGAFALTTAGCYRLKREIWHAPST